MSFPKAKLPDPDHLRNAPAVRRLAKCALILVCLLPTGCARTLPPIATAAESGSVVMIAADTAVSEATATSTILAVTETISATQTITTAGTTAARPSAATTQPTQAATAASAASAAASASPPAGNRLAGYVVVLDPGHQLHANSGQEPVAPGSAIMKDKVSSGTAGTATRRPEYAVNLEISLLMRDWLEAQGCIVYLTRTTNEVDLSNIERAQVALSYDPDVYIRVHCNGSADSSQTGTSVFVANSGVYANQLVAWGKTLAACLCRYTGARNQGAIANASYSGLNWATDIPSFLLEMGYMSNAAEDRLLSDPEYQRKICRGVVDFIAGMPRR